MLLEGLNNIGKVSNLSFRGSKSGFELGASGLTLVKLSSEITNSSLESGNLVLKSINNLSKVLNLSFRGGKGSFKLGNSGVRGVELGGEVTDLGLELSTLLLQLR